MDSGTVPDATLEHRLRECRSQYSRVLNLGYLEGGLPGDFVSLVLRFNPNIAELDLSSNQLACLPDNLGELRELRVLRLKYNALRQLPPVLAALPKLSLLELSGNQIEQLDGDVLAQLSSLRELDISSNGLRFVPDAVAMLPSLETLCLGNNALEQLPDALGSCASLARLDISANRLLSLPPSLAQLQKMQRVDAKNNLLTRVPPCLGHLALKEFDLRYNKLNKTYQQATEKGLARFLNFLREEQEIERLQEIERNRPVGLQVGPCVVYKCRALTADVIDSLGAEGGNADEFAWIRVGHALCMSDKVVYMFGGSILKDGGKKTADLFWLTTDRMEWRLQQTKGDKPCPRDGHCMVLDDVRNRLVVFGGRKQNKRRLNDVYFLDLDTWTWFQPRTEGTTPIPRDQCSATYHDGKMFIFGGRSSTARLNEVHVLDLDAWCWLVPEISGSAPSPRQAAAIAVHEDELWVHGGRSNFVLDDLYCLDLDSGQWRVVPTEGCVMPARYGHAIAHYDSVLYLFGGTDALGATVPSLYKLRKTSATKSEWVEAALALPPNKFRSFLFAKDRLNMMQVGHPALKMQVPAADLAAGRAIWDVFQWASVKDIQEREAQLEDLVPKNAKLERIAHCMADVAAKLPRPFTANSGREQRAMQHIVQFKERWRQQQQQQQQRQVVTFDPPLVLKNECGMDKIVCTTLRPSCLPHVELHDMEGIVQFVSEFFRYEPLEYPSQPPSHLVSPWSLLDWQAGDSFDLATTACSLLLGAGYNAYVAVGFVPKHVAQNDQTAQDCPFLPALGIVQQPAEPPAEEEEREEEQGDEEQHGDNGEAAMAEDMSGSLPAIAEVEEGGTVAGEAELLTIRVAPCSSSRSGTGAATTADGLEATAAGLDPAVGGPGTWAAARDTASEPAEQSAEILMAVEGGAACEEGVYSGADETATAAEGSGANLGASSQLEDAQLDQPTPVDPACYLHAFVLVSPGGREVSQPQFINPATGLCYFPDELPCEGISFAWNQHNAWANVQRTNEQLAAPGATDWAFGNPNAWEPVLATGVDVADSQSVSTELFAGSTTSFLRTTQSLVDVQPPSVPSMMSSSRFTPRSTASAVAAGGARSQRKPHPLQGAAAAVGTPRGASHSTTTDFDAGGSLSYLAPSFGAEESNPRPSPTATSTGGFSPGPDMPTSWVPALVLSRERLDVRCPRGCQRTRYRQCQREIFAKFGECARWDGLVERYTIFQDVECSQVEATIELFQRRKDRLQRRESYPDQRLVKDSFGPGATSSLMESIIIKGDRREFHFYDDSRADGLLRRVEVLGVSMDEYFLGRPDRLVRRKVRYGPPDIALLAAVTGGMMRRGSLVVNPNRASVATGAGESGTGLGDRKGSLLAAPTITYPFAKITERFSRDPAVPCDEDIAKATFDLDENTITAACHYGSSREVLENSGADPPRSADWCKLEYVRLSAIRKAAEVVAHSAEDESQEIILARLRQEQNVQLITGHYNAMRTKVEDSDDEPEGPEEDGTDYLAPYLPAITGTRDMTPSEAAAVYRNCVQASKGRATEKTFRLEARMGADVAEWSRLEVKVATDLHALSTREQDRLQEQLADAKFRVQVLEKRIQDHSRVTSEKLAQLESKLRADPRLLPAIKAKMV